jgi:small-conductance mechanosensitive channel
MALNMGGWMESFTAVMTKREPKTPVAFYSRMLWVITALIVAPLYASIPSEFKIAFLVIGVVLFIALGIFISVLVWKKPAHLLSGEETHLERYKIEYAQGYGSDKGATPPLRGVPEEG